MRIVGSPTEIVNRLAFECPPARDIAARAWEIVPQRKKQILPWQASALYALARPYDHVGAHFLEIGTARGFSASVLHLAASRANIVTLNPDPDEAEIAAGYLRSCPNVTLLRMKSWDYLDIYDGPAFDLIFVDGDHARVAMDLPWFDHLRPMGLMVFHDYDAERCPPVYQGVRAFAAGRGLELAVELIDDSGHGLAAIRRGA